MYHLFKKTKKKNKGQLLRGGGAPHLRGMKRMPLMTFSCSKTLAMLGAVN